MLIKFIVTLILAFVLNLIIRLMFMDEIDIADTIITTIVLVAAITLIELIAKKMRK